MDFLSRQMIVVLTLVMRLIVVYTKCLQWYLYNLILSGTLFLLLEVYIFALMLRYVGN